MKHFHSTPAHRDGSSGDQESPRSASRVDVGHELAQWESMVADWAREQMASSDSGHDINHVSRVVQNAKLICERHPQANSLVVVVSSWLHDCVSVPKDSPLRRQASKMAADAAAGFLRSVKFPEQFINAISHCIAAHSFSAGIPCESLEACIVQDADRLEALGAIGIARCLMTGGSLHMRLYDPMEPFPVTRVTNDQLQSVDHFFAKLLTLSGTMKTEHGKCMAMERTEFLKTFLYQLANEIGVPSTIVTSAVSRANTPS